VPAHDSDPRINGFISGSRPTNNGKYHSRFGVSG